MLTNSYLVVIYTFEKLSAPEGDCNSICLTLLSVHVFFSEVKLNFDIEWGEDYQIPREENRFRLTVFERGDDIDFQGFEDE